MPYKRADAQREANRRSYAKHRTKRLAAHKIYRVENEDRVKETKANCWRKLKYGINLDDYNRMLAAQGGHCAVCPREPKTRRLHIDHDHKTKVVRGLLCFSCNYAIGHLRDSPDLAERIARYLRAAKARSV